MKIHQKLLGIVIPPKVKWTVQKGPSKRLNLSYVYKIGLDTDFFTHMMVMGQTKFGKGVFCSSFGLYMRDNFGFKFIDVNDPDGNYENAYYGYPQSNPGMLARFKDTFYYNEPHGYPSKVLFPGNLTKYPAVFEPFTLNYNDLQPEDFQMFYMRKNIYSNSAVCEALATDYTDIQTFWKAIKETMPEAIPCLRYLLNKGVISEQETTLNFKELADPKWIHSVSCASLKENRQAQEFVTGAVIRLIYDNRFNAGNAPCIIYSREAGTLGDSISRQIATKGRHAGVSFVVDTQRRVSLMDKTTGMQFSSQCFFRVNGEQAEEALSAYDIHSAFAPEISRANQGVCLMNIVGAEKPVFPVAVSPPCSDYKMSNTSFWKYCVDRDVEMIDNG
jgi:hypothetical protein